MKPFVFLCLLAGAAGCYHNLGGDYFVTRTRSDIRNLSTAIGAFKLQFGVTHLPSRIKLSETCNYPFRLQPNSLDSDSVLFLEQMFPRMSFTLGTKVDWNGDGEIKGDHVLEGDECLVFFLSGIPAKRGSFIGWMGFSRDGPTPDAPGGMRSGPFYDFSSSRIRDLHGRGFYSYLDPYGKQPYAYFSAYGKANGYNRYGSTDCPTLGVWPYAEALTPTPRFFNPTSFQIITAGADGKFGPGTDGEEHLWTSATAADMPLDGQDDMSNFSHVRLGRGVK